MGVIPTFSAHSTTNQLIAEFFCYKHQQPWGLSEVGVGVYNESLVSRLSCQRQPEAIWEQKQDLEFLTSDVFFPLANLQSREPQYYQI